VITPITVIVHKDLPIAFDCVLLGLGEIHIRKVLDEAAPGDALFKRDRV
jgi:hypothetical protein